MCRRNQAAAIMVWDHFSCRSMTGHILSAASCLHQSSIKPIKVTLQRFQWLFGHKIMDKDVSWVLRWVVNSRVILHSWSSRLAQLSVLSSLLLFVPGWFQEWRDWTSQLLIPFILRVLGVREVPSYMDTAWAYFRDFSFSVSMYCIRRLDCYMKERIHVLAAVRINLIQTWYWILHGYLLVQELWLSSFSTSRK